MIMSICLFRIRQIDGTNQPDRREPMVFIIISQYVKPSGTNHYHNESMCIQSRVIEIKLLNLIAECLRIIL
jgi:hypothetical protein